MVDTKPRQRCGGGCRECPIGNRAPAAGEPTGGRLALAAAGMFLLPLVAAVAGAATFGPGATGQFLGAVGGLVLGLVGAVLTARRLRSARGGDA